MLARQENQFILLFLFSAGLSQQQMSVINLHLHESFEDNLLAQSEVFAQSTDQLGWGNFKNKLEEMFHISQENNISLVFVKATPFLGRDV